MPYQAKILLDSVTNDGHRLTTFEVTYPRFVHAEFMTHRVFSRNAASSRAIPVTKMIERVEMDPAMPVWFGKNQPGMQANEEVDDETKQKVIEEWLKARDNAVNSVKALVDLKLHKQIANRLLEPFLYITVIVSGTEWTNFFKLRCHPDAQPEIFRIATMMRDLYMSNKPQELKVGQWHIPMITSEEMETLDIEILLKISTARCARISYLTHEGKRDYQEDVNLHDRLAKSGHWSPFEHCAQACGLVSKLSLVTSHKFSNFVGWNQYRKSFEGEDGK